MTRRIDRLLVGITLTLILLLSVFVLTWNEYSSTGAASVKNKMKKYQNVNPKCTSSWRLSTDPCEATGQFLMDCGINDMEGKFVSVSTSKSYPTNKWYHVAGIFKSGSVEMYVNGVRDYGSASGVTPNAFVNKLAPKMTAIGALVRNDNSASSFAEIMGKGLDSSLTGMAVAQGNCPQQSVTLKDSINWFPAEGTPRDVISQNMGQLQGGATYAQGCVGQAFFLNGNSAFVSVPDDDRWAFGSNDFSISLWANFQSKRGGASGTLPNVFIAQDEGAYNVNKWIFLLSDQGLTVHLNSPSGGSVFIGQVPFDPTMGQWYHLAVVRQGRTYSFYVDGKKIGTGSDSRAIPNPSSPLTIGQAEGLGFFNGRLDEIKIFSRALSDAEINEMVNGVQVGKNALPQPPVETLKDSAQVKTLKDSVKESINWFPAEGTPRDMISQNMGQLQGGATYAQGCVGQAFFLNGNSAFVSVPDDDRWAFGSNDFSISLWANFNKRKSWAIQGLPNVFIGQDEGGGNTNKWIFSLGNEGLNFHVNSPSGGSTFIGVIPFDPTMGQWYHLAVVRQGRTYSFYVDGKKIGTGSDSRAIPNPSSPLTIGQAEGLGFFNGRLDEIKIFSRALSNVEIKDIVDADSRICRSASAASSFFNGIIDEAKIFNRALSIQEIATEYQKQEITIPSTPGLVGYWKLDRDFTDSSIQLNNLIQPVTTKQPTAAVGIINTALKFDGVDDYLFNLNTPAINGGEGMSLLAWVYPLSPANPGNYFTILSAGDNTQPSWLSHQCRLLYVNNPKPITWIDANNCPTPNPPSPPAPSQTCAVPCSSSWKSAVTTRCDATGHQPITWIDANNCPTPNPPRPSTTSQACAYELFVQGQLIKSEPAFTKGQALNDLALSKKNHSGQTIEGKYKGAIIEMSGVGYELYLDGNTVQPDKSFDPEFANSGKAFDEQYAVMHFRWFTEHNAGKDVTGFFNGEPLVYLTSIKVLPILLVPADITVGAAEESRLAAMLKQHVAIAQTEYKRMMDGKDTFTIAGDPIIFHSPFTMARYRETNDQGAITVTDDVLKFMKLTRFSSPYVFIVPILNPVDMFPLGGGYPFNGGTGLGGGLFVINTKQLDDPQEHFQMTLEHEMGHAFGLLHSNDYADDPDSYFNDPVLRLDPQYGQYGSKSIMSYSEDNFWHGFTPAANPAILSPEDKRLLANNKLIFPHFSFDPATDIPSGYTISSKNPLFGPRDLDVDKTILHFDLYLNGVKTTYKGWTPLQAIRELVKYIKQGPNSRSYFNEKFMEFSGVGYELFIDGVRAGWEPDWTSDQAKANLKYIRDSFCDQNDAQGVFNGILMPDPPCTKENPHGPIIGTYQFVSNDVPGPVNTDWTSKQAITDMISHPRRAASGKFQDSESGQYNTITIEGTGYELFRNGVRTEHEADRTIDQASNSLSFWTSHSLYQDQPVVLYNLIVLPSVS